MIVILDYGMGNPHSILNMINHIGGNAIVSSDLAVISDATGIILPGVGSFDNGMDKLERTGIKDRILQKVIDEKVPFLGICLGMQLLFDSSEEGILPGLGLIPGVVKRFTFHTDESEKSLKIPHMGWNVVSPSNSNSLFCGLDSNRYYFVHSYHVQCENALDVLATAEYGYKFECAVQKDNIFGVQFHPEKSHRFGMTLFTNFLKEVECFAQE